MTCVFAHPSGDHAHTPLGPQISHPAHDIRIEVTDGPTPWTRKGFKNDPREFQFAVIADNTGSMRPGIVETAVEKLNLLQPEFVMSVGDLIEGYTEDLDRLVFEWDEFDAKIAPLDMRFFYVPGNHDMTNDVMAKLWEERLGRAYYHFVYNDVLFLCLNSEDTKAETITPTQIAWIEQTLAEHTDVRWTMVFMHKPLWQYEMNYAKRGDSEKSTGWLEVEALLKERKHTVMCGHYHRYAHYDINNSDYIILSTTGGGSQLRGPEYGEVDQIAWITMTDTGPIISNILIDGVLPKDFSKPETGSFTFDTLRLVKVAVGPHYSNEGEMPAVWDTEIYAENKGRDTVTITLEIPEIPGLEITAETSAFDLEPETELQIPFRIRSSSGGPIVLPTPIEIPYAVAANLDDDISVEFIEKLIVNIAPTYPAQGDALDWITVGGDDFIGGNTDAWSGPEDGSFQFKVEQIEGNLEIEIIAVDDALVPPSEVEHASGGDGIELRISPITDPLRSIETTRFWQDQNKNYFAMYLVPDVPTRAYSYNYGVKVPEGVTSECISNPDGSYRATISIPISVIDSFAGGDASKVRLSIGQNDRDSTSELSAQIWWPEDWRSEEMVPGSGTFDL